MIKRINMISSMVPMHPGVSYSINRANQGSQVNHHNHSNDSPFKKSYFHVWILYGICICNLKIYQL